MSTTGIVAYNLGTGKGYSVLDLVSIFEKVSGRKIPYTFYSEDQAMCGMLF